MNATLERIKEIRKTHMYWNDNALMTELMPLEREIVISGHGEKLRAIGYKENYVAAMTQDRFFQASMDNLSKIRRSLELSLQDVKK